MSKKTKTAKTTTKTAKSAKPPILTGADAVAALKKKGDGKKRPWRERAAIINQEADRKFQAGQATSTIDAGGGILVDVVEKISPEQKVANAAGKALKGTPAPKAGKTKKPRAPKEGGKMSGLDAAAKVLGDAEMPLNTKMIVDRMLEQGLWKTNGKTPAATIYSAILREIDSKPGESRFKKTDRGLFTLATNKK